MSIGASGSLGANEPNVENWRTVSRLAGHTSDVLDLAWSPDQQYLASCGIDNTVRIWGVDTWRNLQVLSRHVSIVRGIAWDPLSKFLLSQAEDDSAIIWRSEDWAVESQITEPFKMGSSQTYFRRASWMPDGSYTVIAAAFKGLKHSVTVLQRGTWGIESEFIGHNGPIICTCCNPQIFNKKFNGSTESSLVMYCAVVSQDKQVTLWSTARQQPLFLLNKIFDHIPVDISWSADGYSLLICSLDGSVATIKLNEAELGIPLSRQEKQDHLQKIHGAVATGSRALTLAETPMQLALEAASQKPSGGDDDMGAGHMSPLTAKLGAQQTGGGDPFAAPARQVETRLPSGKRRINPVRMDPMTGATLGGGGAMEVASALPPHMRGMVSSPGQKRKPEGEPLGSPLKRARGEIYTESESQGHTMGSEGGTHTYVYPSALVPRGGRIFRELSPAKAWPSEEGRVSIETEVSKTPEGVCKVSSHHGDVLAWVDYLPSEVTAVGGNSEFVAVGCIDGSLYLYSPAGRRLLPALLLSAPPKYLEASATGSHVVAVCADGSCVVFDLSEEEEVLNTSVLPLLDAAKRGESILKVTIAGDKSLTVYTALRGAFRYHLKLKSWLRLQETNFVHSNFYSSVDNGNERALPVARTESAGRLMGLLANASSTERCQVTTAHLETQLSSISKFNKDGKAGQEAKAWLVAYVRHLASAGMESRLREVCNTLRGKPVLGSMGDIRALLPPEDRDVFLRETVLPILGSNRAIQRFAIECKEMVDGSDSSIIDRGVLGVLAGD